MTTPATDLDERWHERVVIAAARVRYVWTPALGRSLSEHLANNVFAAIDIDCTLDVAAVTRSALEHERRAFHTAMTDRTIDLLVVQAVRVWAATSASFAETIHA